jgi:putative secretion activating protein
MNIEKLICTEIEFDNKKYKVIGVNFEKDNIILNVEEIKEEKTTENESIKPVYSFSQASLDKMSKVHPKLVEVMKEAIKNSPFDFRITDGARTAEEQNALYQKGRSKPGPKVTNCDGYKAKSNHQIKADGFGHAVDIFPCGIEENGEYRKFTSEEGYDDKKLKIISEHILKIAKENGVNVEWGGNWKMHDTPHFEIK